MPNDLMLHIAVHENKHHLRVLDGSFSIEGCRIEPIPLAGGEMYSRVFEQPNIDVGEISIARYVSMHSTGTCKFLALPYYFAREFQHATFYVRSDFPARDPSEISGCTVGLSEYDHTGHTWSRALLQDEYGVPPEAVKWIAARREESRPPIRHFFEPPAGVSITYAPPEKYLAKMLLDGEIDVMINPGEPSCFVEQPDRVRRLVRDHLSAERAYYTRTGICPIQHVLGVRKELLEAHPWLGPRLVNAFIETVGAERAIFKPQSASDVVPELLLHGTGPKERASLETFLRHHHSQGMSQHMLPFDAFFRPRKPA